MERDLPIYEIYIDEQDNESGVQAIALVEQPANEYEWIAFSNDNGTDFKFDTDDSKQMITSVIMMPDTPIYRRYGDQEFYVQFSKETIEKMMVKYFKENKIHNVNEQHDGNKVVDGVYLVESLIVDDRFTSNKFDVPNGTWIGTFYVEDKEYYNELIESPEFNGFSLEGQFKQRLLMSKDEKLLKDILDILNSDGDDEESFNKIKKMLK